MKPSTSTVTLGLLLSLAGPSGVALAADATSSSAAPAGNPPQMVMESADSDDLTPIAPTKPTLATQPTQTAALPPATVSDENSRHLRRVDDGA